MRKFDVDQLDGHFYFVIKSPLEELSSSELLKLVQGFYSGESTDYILKSHHIDLDSKRMRSVFPYVEIDEVCPYDGTPLVMKLPSVNAVDSWAGDEVCRTCGHRNVDPTSGRICECDGCVSKRKVFNSELREEYSSENHFVPEYSDLPLYAKLELATFVREMNVTDVENILSYDYVEPLFFYDYLFQLTYEKVIEPSAQNPVERFKSMFPKNGSLNYDYGKIDWRLNVQAEDVPDDELVEFLGHPDHNILQEKRESDAFYHLTIRNILLSIFVDIFDKQLDPKDNYHDLEQMNIEDWLISNSPKIVASAIVEARVEPDDFEFDDPDFDPIHAVSYYIQHPDEISDQAVEEATFDNRLNQPVCQIFFNDVLLMPDWMDKLVPIK
ncbi:hypothetical protein [Companilactobacillus ginsenosidimutans]|uniref:Uncharacterized protein n=1 Tax=Companilactobacillus ginsenosidimutans TaxID=1007676 RepID=A0A0H4QKF9_9LACO|nr:hypothetical protein [Companilactobacillus ginsenosidimutans]AKP67193.1 hypothetical protein ABM34_06355 [Companilactobacillus ginsenosidimutans]